MSKFRCPDCFRPNATPKNSDNSEITCVYCNKSINVPTPTYSPDHDLNGFVIQEWLGNGSLGEIYLAKQTSINDRPTALKIVTKEHIRSEEDMERFFREIKVVATLNHKHIATAFIAGKFDDGVYLASRYVEGKTLDEILSEKELTEEEIVKYSKGIALALQYAWERHQILHRDLKPTNFMVDSTGHIFLVDMCVAKSLEILSDITMQGNVVGTPYYISPEQAAAESELDEKTDMYGLGATMFHMITGHPPYFNEGTQLEIAAKKMRELPTWPEGTEDKFSQELLDTVMKLMAIKKEDRPADWNEAIELLESLESTDDEEVESEEDSTEEESSVSEEESSSVNVEVSESKGPNMALILAIIAVVIIIAVIALK